MRKQAVVYTARDKQQAHLLRSLLEEAGFEAAVTGEASCEDPGADAAAAGTGVQVVVARRDASAARRLIEDLDRRGALASAPGRAPAAEQEDVELAEWPCCPECGARRTTTCPVCQTSGTDFPQADSDFAASLELEKPAAPTSCDCGSGGCCSRGPATGDQSALAEPEAGASDEAGHEPACRPGLVVMCTMCDEPFEPQFLRRCEWCGHEFPDGHPVDVAEGPPGEEITPRALAVMFALGLLAIGAIAYFLLLVPGK